MRKIILVNGVSSSGKSFIINSLKKYYKFFYLDFKQDLINFYGTRLFFDEKQKKVVKIVNGDKNNLILNFFKKKVKYYLEERNHIPLVLEIKLLTPEERKWLYELCKFYKCKLYILNITVRKNILKEYNNKNKIPTPLIKIEKELKKIDYSDIKKEKYKLINIENNYLPQFEYSLKNIFKYEYNFKNKTIYVISDIHGDFLMLKKLLKKHLELKKNIIKIKENQVLIVLGDFLDRGKSNLKIFNILYNTKKKYPNNCFILLGNHEEKILRILEKHKNINIYPNQIYTLKEFLKVNWLKKLKKFLHELPYALYTEKYIFTHSPIIVDYEFYLKKEICVRNDKYENIFVKNKSIMDFYIGDRILFCGHLFDKTRNPKVYNLDRTFKINKEDRPKLAIIYPDGKIKIEEIKIRSVFIDESKYEDFKLFREYKKLVKGNIKNDGRYYYLKDMIYDAWLGKLKK